MDGQSFTTQADPMTSRLSLPAALIFDMDGVLVDSNPFHIQKWIEFLNDHHTRFNPDELPGLVLGQRNDIALRHFFGSQLRPEDALRLSEDLEQRFRDTFRPYAQPLPGLAALVAECHRAGIPMAVASSAMTKNIEFVVEALGFRPYFRCLVSGDEVAHPKPDPEIYLKTASKLGFEPAACVAFEDSYVGVESAHRAGMKCVAIASTFPVEELRRRTPADLVALSFKELNLEGLRRLFVRKESVSQAARDKDCNS